MLHWTHIVLTCHKTTTASCGIGFWRKEVVWW